MKKSIARIVSVLLVVLMAMAMIPAVSAAVTIDTTTDRVITVTNQYAGTTSEGEVIASADLEFTAYKVATFSQVGNKLVYTMTSNTTSTGLNAESTETDVTLSASATGTVLTQSGDSFVLKADKDNALYLIKCTKKPTNVKYVNPVLVQVPNMYNEATEWQYTATVAPKAGFQTAGSSKYIVENDELKVSTTATGADGERTGDAVTFQLEAKVLGTTADPMTLFTLKDTMSKGLTYNNDAKVYGIKIADGSETEITENFTVNASTYDATNGTTIDFAANDAFLTAGLYDYATVKVVYTATVNENAVMGSTGNPNTVYLEYDNDNDDNHDKTPESTVIVYTYGVKIVKYDADGTTPLAGAEFEIADATGKVLDKGVTGADGKLNFERLAPGTYTVTETKAPAGYQLLANSISVTVSADNATTDGMFQISVTNSKFQTPVTGGIGSTIFVVAGIAIIALGGTLLFVATRKRESK